jgi:hypothetical protein
VEAGESSVKKIALSGLTSKLRSLFVQLDHPRLADHSHERSDALDQLKSTWPDVDNGNARHSHPACVSAPNHLAARGLANLNLTRVISSS